MDNLINRACKPKFTVTWILFIGKMRGLAFALVIFTFIMVEVSSKPMFQNEDIDMHNSIEEPIGIKKGMSSRKKLLVNNRQHFS